MPSNRPSETILKKAAIVAVALAAVVFSGCASISTPDSTDLRPLVGQETPRFDFDDLQHVSDDMAKFLDRHIPPGMSDRQRVWQLTMVTSDKYILGFNYDPTVTTPPSETFARRRGNCLAFSLMLVAMARHVGIPAQLHEVYLPPEYSSRNDTFINSRHINVELGSGARTFVVDVSGKDISRSIRTRPVSLREAEAQYYNNLGVDELLSNNLPAAVGRFQQAIDTHSKLPYLWSNLGVAYNRASQVDDAEWAFQIALSSHDYDTSALYNLYLVYQQEERWLEAAKLEQKVDRHRRRNPYYLAMLADEALASREYNEAIALLKRSIRINSEEYRFHGALAEAQYLAGDRERAQDTLDKARALAPSNVEAIELPLEQN